jgi:hypothetical protein
VSEPTNYPEYAALYEKNSTVTGFGEFVIHHMPCPFCAAPNFMAIEVFHHGNILGPTQCDNCKRSAKVIYEHFTNGSAVRLYQTNGPDQPKWLQPPLPISRSPNVEPDEVRIGVS